MKTFVRALLVAAATIAPLFANTAQNQPIVLVIPFSAGGSNDSIGRYLADRLSRLWHQTVVVENRPGAGSAIGAAHVARSAPDGHTLLFVSSSLTTMAATVTNLPFDPMKDLQTVGLAAVGQSVIVTGSRIRMPTLASLIEQSRERTIFYGTAGVGTTSHLAAELLNDAAGIKMTTVHYRGASNAMIDMAGGRLDVYVGAVASLMSSIASGTATPVAVAGRMRDPAIPDVPTAAEAGFPGMEADVWWGVFAPAGTPAAEVSRINAGINAVMETPESRALLAKNGAVPRQLSVEAFELLVAADLQKWSRLAKARGISTN
ncbi:MAG: tripartite tricarboxylate transporter substrate binding protein [Acidobacteria bacterium]|nr:tripartite tricarboxylate transporter substrate binding protein [Acidobacteriota bacterium]